ncbi:hypothetical protein BC832DRAFT_17335 [Gaertneriomyces semiglobifer]|nr:hypothetical protein BC832DRAFT_17335 [Gaertneriomyces semiglobifer]
MLPLKVVIGLAALFQGAAAFVQAEVEFDAPSCKGKANTVTWFTNTQKEEFLAASCREMARLRGCDSSSSMFTNFGAMSTSTVCLDSEATDPGKIRDKDFFPESSRGGHYFIMTEYSNELDSEKCSKVKEVGTIWSRSARVADGQCRSAGASPDSLNGADVRHMRISCQIDGSAYVQDWCDATCGNCQFNSVVGYKECGPTGSAKGGEVMMGGYCVLADKGGIPSERPPKGWSPPPPTGQQVVESSSLKLATGTTGTVLFVLLGVAAMTI